MIGGLYLSKAGVRSIVRLDADRATFRADLAIAARIDAELARDAGVRSAVDREVLIERMMTRRIHLDRLQRRKPE